MFKNVSMIISLIFLSVDVFAAGGSTSGGHLGDLLFPAINAFLFFSFLGWKLKKPLADMFTEKAVEIEEFNKLAEQKNKEAQLKLEEYENKLKKIQTEILKIKENNNSDVGKLLSEFEVETKEKLERMKRDAENKLESEKNEIVRSLYAELVDAVLVKAKVDIKGDSSKKENAANKLMARL